MTEASQAESFEATIERLRNFVDGREAENKAIHRMVQIAGSRGFDQRPFGCSKLVKSLFHHDCNVEAVEEAIEQIDNKYNNNVSTDDIRSVLEATAEQLAESREEGER